MSTQCHERCLGVQGHGGFHQTSDYPMVLVAQRQDTVEHLRNRLVAAMTDEGMERVPIHPSVILDWLDEEAAR